MKQAPLFKAVVSVDCVVFAYADRKIYLPMLLRGCAPFENAWSLPGGPIKRDETPEQACLRKLQEDIGLKVQHCEQLYTFGDPKRDPRERAFSIAYFALIKGTPQQLVWGPDIRTAQWFEIDKLPQHPWAFDHHAIVETALARLRAKVTYEPIGLKWLPKEFSLAELKQIYDLILGRSLDRRNFYKKIKTTGVLVPTRTIPSRRGKPTQLFRFDVRRYRRLREEGQEFGI